MHYVVQKISLVKFNDIVSCVIWECIILFVRWRNALGCKSVNAQHNSILHQIIKVIWHSHWKTTGTAVMSQSQGSPCMALAAMLLVQDTGGKMSTYDALIVAGYTKQVASMQKKKNCPTKKKWRLILAFENEQHEASKLHHKEYTRSYRKQKKAVTFVGLPPPPTAGHQPWSMLRTATGSILSLLSCSSFSSTSATTNATKTSTSTIQTVETNELSWAFYLYVRSLWPSFLFYMCYYSFIFNTHVYGSDTCVNSSQTYFGHKEILLLEIPSRSCLWNSFALPSLPSILWTVFHPLLPSAQSFQ